MKRNIVGVVTLPVVVATAVGCASSKEDVVDQVLEDSGVELDDLGGSLPESFPAEVPVPTEGVELESAVGAAGNYVMRYGLSDPAAATAAYRSALESAGFTVETEFDNLGAAGNNVGFIAGDGSWEVTVSAFGEDEIDGLYMGVTVTAVS